jgi:hypothetical protein
MLAVDEKRLGELVQDFYRAFLAADGETLAEVVAPEAAWIVRLETALSGAHVGPIGIAALRRQIDELSAGTWRPLREDSFDIATSHWQTPAGPQGTAFRLVLERLGWRHHQTLVWVKNAPVLGHSDHHYQHEELLYGWTPGPGAPGGATRPGAAGTATTANARSSSPIGRRAARNTRR